MADKLIYPTTSKEQKALTIEALSQLVNEPEVIRLDIFVHRRDK